jgi:hypothetical protein
MWVLAEGTGTWDGTITNPNNPQRRDVQILPPGLPGNPGYIVIQINADNPGVWPFVSCLPRSILFHSPDIVPALPHCMARVRRPICQYHGETK